MYKSNKCKITKKLEVKIDLYFIFCIESKERRANLFTYAKHIRSKEDIRSAVERVKCGRSRTPLLREEAQQPITQCQTIPNLKTLDCM